MTDTRHAIIFYDGDCGLCHATVRFVLKRDTKKLFSFAPLQGSAALEVGVPASSNGVVLRLSDGNEFRRSDAIIAILQSLPGAERHLAAVLKMIPRPLRELGYSAVARIRRLLWQKPEARCPLVSEEVSKRFLP